MAKQLLEMDHRPTTPSPSCDTASDGLETGRDLARRYLVDAVRLFAGVAFARDSEAALHSRVLAARAILTVAGIAPQAAPAPPPP